MNARMNKGFWCVIVATGVVLASVWAVTVGLGTLAAAAPMASPIYVRTDGDDANCNGTVDAAYPASGNNCAFQTIQQGIDLVDVGGTVMVRAGTYVENLGIAKDVTLLGAGAGSTILDANASGNGVYVNDTTADVTISGFTIRNAGGINGHGIRIVTNSALTLTSSTVSDNTDCSNCNGAGFRLYDGATAVISNCTFSNNVVTGGRNGGAIENQGANLTIVNSTFMENRGTGGGRGGAIHSWGLDSSLTVIGSLFFDNTITGTNSYGGAIWHDTGVLVIDHTTFLSNATEYVGGAIAMSGGAAHIYGSLFADNWCLGTVDSCYGGAIYNYTTILLIEDSMLRDNWVSGNMTSVGGGIFSDGPTTLNRVTVSGNSSDSNSGGIHSQDPLTMTNVTLSGNSAVHTGSGLMQTGTSVDAGNFVNCTFVGNTLSDAYSNGGALHTYSTVNMTNTLLANNDYANCGASGTVNSGGHNMEDGDSCDLGVMGDVTSTALHVAPLSTVSSPLVGAPGTQERMGIHILSRSNPAIDGADDTQCPPVDQRGVARPIDGDGDSMATCDVGAYEFDLVNGLALPLVLRDY